MSEVLILSASYGEGHNAAARSLTAAFNERDDALSARRVDILNSRAPRRDAVARWAYYQVINRMPRGWSAFYAWLDRAKPFPRLLWMLRKEEALLEAMIRQRDPVAVCNTYPIFAFMVTRIAQRLGRSIPCYNVVTDSISINSMWWLSACDGWFVPNAESAGVMIAAGCERSQIHVMGFPVQTLFGHEEKRLHPPRLVEGAKPAVLYIINSGSRLAMETAASLLAPKAWRVTFAVGRDKKLRRRIEQLVQSNNADASVLGWTDKIPQLLMSHHVVISKAGGATTQEAIAAHCPMIVNQIVPGQEEGNYEFLRRHDIGGRAETPSEIVTLLRSAFAENASRWEGWHRKLAALDRSTAARDIANFVSTRHGAVTEPNESISPPPVIKSPRHV
ncbi:MAG: glycosyltransferase [Synoicihabitans sp.]